MTGSLGCTRPIMERGIKQVGTALVRGDLRAIRARMWPLLLRCRMQHCVMILFTERLTMRICLHLALWWIPLISDPSCWVMCGTLLDKGEQPSATIWLKLWWPSVWCRKVKMARPLTTLRTRTTGALVVLMLLTTRLCRIGGRLLRARCRLVRWHPLLIRLKGHTVMRAVRNVVLMVILCSFKGPSKDPPVDLAAFCVPRTWRCRELLGRLGG